MRSVLLDTNVWRYVGDDAGEVELRSLARDVGAAILISPSVVFEQLRHDDPVERRRLVEVSTRQWWVRMMPEAYAECEELVAAVRVLRPQWIRTDPDREQLRTYSRNRADWQHGFWQRARKESAFQAHLNEELGGHRISAARGQVDAAKADVRATNLTLDTVDLDAAEIRDCLIDGPGGHQIRTQLWRVGAASHFINELLTEGSPPTYHDWLDPYLSDRVMRNRSEWTGFWLDVEAAAVPTQWLAWAAGVLVPLVKVNPGTVFDTQLATYLHRADVFITADRRFHRIAETLRRHAPFPVATSVFTSAQSWRDDLAAALPERSD